MSTRGGPTLGVMVAALAALVASMAVGITAASTLTGDDGTGAWPWHAWHLAWMAPILRILERLGRGTGQFLWVHTRLPVARTPLKAATAGVAVASGAAWMCTWFLTGPTAVLLAAAIITAIYLLVMYTLVMYTLGAGRTQPTH